MWLSADRHLLRLSLAVLTFLSALFLPWPVTVLCALLLLFSATAYEVPFIGLFADLLYRAPAPVFFGFEFLFGAAFLLFFLGVEFLKRRLVFYAL